LYREAARRARHMDVPSKSLRARYSRMPTMPRLCLLQVLPEFCVKIDDLVSYQIPAVTSYGALED